MCAKLRCPKPLRLWPVTSIAADVTRSVAADTAVAAPPGRSRVAGHLDLRFRVSAEAGRTVLDVRAQQPPLRVIRAFPIDAGGTLVHLHNISGGVLGDDRLELAVDVGPGAYAQLTSTGA